MDPVGLNEPCAGAVGVGAEAGGGVHVCIAADIGVVIAADIGVVIGVGVADAIGKLEELTPGKAAVGSLGLVPAHPAAARSISATIAAKLRRPRDPADIDIPLALLVINLGLRDAAFTMRVTGAMASRPLDTYFPDADSDPVNPPTG
jgi:hypothetical protein